MAWAGGFLMIWLYNQPWFLDFSFFGTDMQTLFQIHPINLSVAIWVGFLALFGIAVFGERERYPSLKLRDAPGSPATAAGACGGFPAASPRPCSWAVPGPCSPRSAGCSAAPGRPISSR